MRCPLGWFALSLVLALLLWSGSAAAQRGSLEGGELDRMRDERRIALVIGNGAYGPRIGPLANPTNDARDIAAALGDLGFEVALELDADRDRMRRAVIDFGRSLRDGGIGLFYFSGHAVQLDGLNYMIPLGAEVESEDYVPVETVDVNDVLARMGSADNRLNIVILDACRNNPFKGIFRALTRGLAQTRSPTGTFIAYAAAPGDLALDGKGTRNSPYTKALLETLEEPGLDLEDVFKRVRREVLERTDRFQTPWTGSSIIGDFYFRLPEPIEAKPETPAPTPAPVAPWALEWSAIKDSGDPKDFETFIERYPALAPYARNRLARLRQPDTVPPTPSVTAPLDPATLEAGLDLRPEDRTGIQEALTALGFETGPTDGIFGANTRRAIIGWQRGRGDEPTGYLSATQYGQLLAEAEPKLAALAAARQKPEQAAPVQPAIGIYQFKPGDEFRDCEDCPLMVVVPAGSFTMGSTEAERTWAVEQGAKQEWVDREKPQHPVTIERPFAVGKYEVTVGQFTAFVQATDHDMSGGCWEYTGSEWKENASRNWRASGFEQTESHPLVCVSWDDAKKYVAWLSEKTRQQYRLLSEAEWEYAARAETTTMRPWGDDRDNKTGCTYANGADLTAKDKFSDWRTMNCHDGHVYTASVGSYSANGFRLHDMIGNVWEWVEDCWHDSYDGALDDGSAWTSGNCGQRALRGGAWVNGPEDLRSASRVGGDTDFLGYDVGFRVARTLSRSERALPLEPLPLYPLGSGAKP